MKMMKLNIQLFGASASAPQITVSSSAGNKGYVDAFFIEHGTNIANNTSEISVVGKLTRKTGSWGQISTPTLYIYWYDDNENKGGKLVDSVPLKAFDSDISPAVVGASYDKSTGVYTYNKKFNVKHHADGSLSGYAVAKYVYTGSYQYTYASGTATTANTALTKIPRYLSISSFGCSSKTETTLTYSWSVSDTASKVVAYYKKSSDANYSSTTVYNDASGSKSGTFTIGANQTANYTIAANTTYDVYIVATRLDSGLNTPSDVSTITTYNYPYITGIKTAELKIGSSQVLSLYNPLSRTVAISATIPNPNTGGTSTLFFGNSTAKEITITPDIDALYKSIPESQTGVITYYCDPTGSGSTTSKSGTFICNEADCRPIISAGAIQYKELSETVINLIGEANNQTLIQGHSQLGVMFSAASPQNYAKGIKSYKISCSGAGISEKIETSVPAAHLDFGKVSSTTITLSLIATDSRNYNSAEYKITINSLPWSKPTVSLFAKRRNDFNEETDIVATIENWTDIKINNINYNSKQEKAILTLMSSEGTSLSSNPKIYVFDKEKDYDTSTYKTASTVDTLDGDKVYFYQVQIEDAFGASSYNYATAIVNRGVPIAMVDGEKLGVGINCFPDGKGLYVDGDAKITNLIDVITFKGKSFYGTNGTAGYVHICDITSNETYRNQSISMDVLQRGRLGTVTLNFTNNSTAGALAISSLQTTGKIEAYYTSTLQADGVKTIISLYIKKTEGYDQIDITNVNKGQYMTGVNIEWKNILATSLPSGAIGATDADLDKIYPKGSIYMSTQNISPASFLGGEWAPLKDRFLLGAGNSYAVNAKGGYKASQTHSHGIPALKGTAASEGGHQHTYYLPPNWSFKIGTGTKNTVLDEPGSGLTAGYSTAKDGAHTHPVTTNASTTGEFKIGTDGAAATATDGNMPPYLAVYMWERTG